MSFFIGILLALEAKSMGRRPEANEDTF